MRTVFFLSLTAAASAWVEKGVSAGDEEVAFTASLRQNNTEWLEQEWKEIVADVKGPRWRAFRTIDEINEKVGASQDDISEARAWAHAHGITINTAYPDSLQMSGSVSAVKSAMGSVLTLYTFTNGKVDVVTSKNTVKGLTLPPSITSIHGLYKPTIVRSKRAVQRSDVASISPQTIRQQYNISIPTASIMGNISVGQMSFCPVSVDDCNQYCQEGNLNCKLDASSIKGPHSELNPCGEADMDVQMGYAAGPRVPLTVDGGYPNMLDWATSWFNNPKGALASSLSYGDNEGAGDNALNNELMKLGVAGKAVFIASGDAGAPGQACVGKFKPDWPATSPYVTAVGATESTPGSAPHLKNPSKLCTDRVGPCVGKGAEEAVSVKVSQFTSGGGFSQLYEAPTWQADVVNAYLSSGVKLPPSDLWNKKGRGYPDVAAFGGQNLVVTKRIVAQSGGTSASSPIWVGVWGILNSAALKKTGKPLGPAAPYLYHMHAQAPHCFTDITVGDNICPDSVTNCALCHGFRATKGWDPVSGLGSPNVDCMLAFVEKDLQ
eukprot:TRINITY_DN3477_c0_g3_i1.p1 TRINITY_DN3477_c0_g3~~TRINITY_DN3477_c0_g3_i1.p1  ORF type:complete len:549 (+),score=109.25 TRINITY_DN3477_c0_g3_i1:43-1689(+)